MNESLSREVQSRRAAQAALEKREREVERLQREISAYKVPLCLGMIDRAMGTYPSLRTRVGTMHWASAPDGSGEGGVQEAVRKSGQVEHLVHTKRNDSSSRSRVDCAAQDRSLGVLELVYVRYVLNCPGVRSPAGRERSITACKST